MSFILQKSYSRQQIHDALGGDLQSYLPHIQGQVVCACFDPELNARAPFEVDVGNKPNVIEYAKRLARQQSAIPVFLKRGNLEWEFVGRFSAYQLIWDSSDLHPAKPFRRPDAVAVLYLSEERQDPELSSGKSDEIEALEGHLMMRTHRYRERSPILADAKRRAFRAEHGVLQCEACSLDERRLPAGIGDACFEVHHLRPLSELKQMAVTCLGDLAIVCANCHRMIHRSDPMLLPSELSRRRHGDAQQTVSAVHER